MNIATLASPDAATMSEPYRHVLNMHGVALKQPSEYDTTSRLYVISTGNEQQLRKDLSVQMTYFREISIKETIPVSGTDWKVFWFQK